MATLTIDFETYYDREYSLTKMTTQEYLFDSRFEVIGVSVAKDDQSPKWFTGDYDETKQWLEQFPWDSSIVVSHNSRFDGSILEWHYGLRPKQYFCTLMASRALLSPFTKNGRVSLAVVAEHLGVGQKGTAVESGIGLRRINFGSMHMMSYANYCKNDTALCYKIYKHLSPKLPPEEKELIHETVIKTTHPKLLLDKEVLEERYARILLEKASVLGDAGLKTRDVLMSNPQFAAALEKLGVDPPMKTSPTTGKQTFAFAKNDVEFTELLEHPDIRVQYLVAARLRHKSTIEQTRIERFLKLAKLDTPVAIPINYYAAHTGRLGGADKLNFQNLHRGGTLRKAIVAPPGHTLVAADLSQIEARILACMAVQSDLIGAFAKGEDVYCLFASKIFGRTITKADFHERFIGKTAILGLGYGMGWKKFQLTIKASAGISITDDEAARIVREYRNTYMHIPNLWDTMSFILQCMANGTAGRLSPIGYAKEHIRLPNGMCIHYPDMQVIARGYKFNFKGKFREIWGGALTENIIQALARIVISNAELQLARRGLHAVLQVHDELVYCVLDRHVDRVTKALQLALTATVPWMPDLPVACEINTGRNFGECK
jgi:DNA polymerase